MPAPARQRIVTVTLNPAVDRVIEAPEFAIGKRSTGREVARYPTGKGVTISRVLSTIGVRSIATGFVGRNELGMFEEHLERAGEGRAVCQFLVVRARTRDNITIVDPVSDTETHIRDAGFQVQPDDVSRMASKIGMLAREGTIVCFGGSLPPGLEPDQFGRMVGRCVSAGVRVAIDVSPQAWRGLKGRPIWLARLNAEQLHLISNEPVDTPEQLISAALSLTVVRGGPIENLVITLGADGAILVGQHATLKGQVSVHPGRVVSTVGCGEALLAGLVASLERNENDWEGALTEGLALATANAVGQEAGKLDIEDVAEFRFMTMIESLPLPTNEPPEDA